MAVELKITYEGDVPGLSEHRLSLLHFGEALAFIPRTLRRIASGLGREQGDGREYGRRGGRLSTAAELIDATLTQIVDNCVTVVMEIEQLPTNRHGQVEIPTQALLRRTGDAFIKEMRSIGEGVPSSLVQGYFEKLPREVSKHRYQLLEAGRVVSEVALTDVPTQTESGPLPSSRHVVGEIVSCGFAPGAYFVGIGDARRVWKCEATDVLVERALSLRGQNVQAMIVTSDGSHRLAWLLPAADGFPRQRKAERDEANLTRWADVLRRLA